MTTLASEIERHILPNLHKMLKKAQHPNLDWLWTSRKAEAVAFRRRLDELGAELHGLADDAEEHPHLLHEPREPLFEQPTARTYWVYFIRRHIDGAVKIGFSNDPVKRLHAIETGAGKCTLLATCLGGVQLENQLHRRFAADRLTGEWFRLSDDLLAFIRHIVMT